MLLRLHEELIVTTWNYTWSNLEIVCNKLSSTKQRCAWTSSWKRPPVVRFLIGSISCKRWLSLCILGGCLRKVRLYSTSDIIGIETTKKKIKLFVFFCIFRRDFPFLWCYWFSVPVSFSAKHPLLFIPTIGSLPHWRADSTEEQMHWELEHFCDSHIYKCWSQAGRYGSCSACREK